jgi:hypothetical protein
MEMWRIMLVHVKTFLLVAAPDTFETDERKASVKPNQIHNFCIQCPHVGD